MEAGDIAAGSDEGMPGRVAAVMRDEKRIGGTRGEGDLLGNQGRDGGRGRGAVERWRLAVAMESHDCPP